MTIDSPQPYTKEEISKKIGNTSLIKFESLSKEIGRNIYFKAEYENPGGSIKDRPALYLLNDLLQKGKIQPGGNLVEGTSGNSGNSLAMLAKCFNPPFNVILFVPDNLVPEKIKCMEASGCAVVKCPDNLPPTDPRLWTNAAEIFAKKTPNSVFVNQMGNTCNRKAHYETTGPEIYNQLHGKIDGFAASAGTGGTFMGTASYLKDATNNSCKCWFADKKGSGLHQFIKTNGKSWDTEGSSFVEGIGKKCLTGQMHDALEIADDAVMIEDTDSIVTIYRLIHEQDCWIGASGGLNIQAAKELALTLPEGSNVVTTVADSAQKYSSKLFNKQWLIDNGHWEAIPDEMKQYATFVVA